MADEVKKLARALVVRAAGTNCEAETRYACERAGFWTDVLHMKRVIQNPAMLANYHLFVIPGGFTYGDDVGAGKILAGEIRFKLLEPLKEFVKAGKLVLGICNGFQVLVKCGLLPDPFAAGEQRATLTDNDSMRYEDRWVHLKICSKKSEFIRDDGAIIQLPIAHGEGKFVTADEGVLKELERNNQVVLRYVDEDGREAGYPWNPNGSVKSIAGICDPTGKVFGLMPHPERFADPFQHPQWTMRSPSIKPDGIKFFENAMSYVERDLL